MLFGFISATCLHPYSVAELAIEQAMESDKEGWDSGYS